MSDFKSTKCFLCEKRVLGKTIESGKSKHYFEEDIPFRQGWLCIKCSKEQVLKDEERKKYLAKVKKDRMAKLGCPWLWVYLCGGCS